MDADGKRVAPVTTDAPGHHVFDNLLPGPHKITFSTPPTDHEFTTRHAKGADSGTDSPPAPPIAGGAPHTDQDGAGTDTRYLLLAGFAPLPLGALALAVSRRGRANR